MLTKRDMLITLQLSVVGIVLVLGLFWILRSIRRLDDRVQVMMEELQMDRASSGMWNPQQCGLPNFKEAEEAMAKLFNIEPEIIMTAPMTNTDSVVIEEEEKAEPKTLVFPLPKVPVDESVSEVETDGQLSKTKIKKMSLEQLRLECGKLSLASDGTRKELMERLLATLPN